MEIKFCQSCGMPLSDDLYGTNHDKTKNEEYCSYCYQDGEFTSNMNMEEMIEICVPIMLKEHEALKEEDVRKELHTYIPTLKRWK